MADHDETMSKLSPGARNLLQMAEGLCLKYDHETITCRHLLQLLLERHGPMAEDLCPGLKADAKLREVTDQLTRGETGTPVESTLIAAEAVKKAEARGKSVAYERDLAAVILEANGLVAVTQTATTSQTATAKDRRSRKPSAKKGRWLPDVPLDPDSPLWQFGRDLTLEAQDGKLPPLVGREEETDLLIETLCRRTKRNPALVGPAGVGKTAIVEGLAQRIVAGDVPEPLRHRRIVALQASLLIAGAGTFGEIEKRMKAILAEAIQEGVLLFIDEVHSLMGAGGREGATDLASQLKPVLARGEIACIAATTDDEYRRFIERDEALERRFQPVRIQEPSAEETLQVLLRLRTDLTTIHKIEVPDEVLQWLVTFAETHMRNRHFPDKGVDLLEQVVAHALAHREPKVTQEIAEQVARRIVGLPIAAGERLGKLRERLETSGLLGEEDREDLLDRLAVTLRGLDLRQQRPNAVILLVDEAADHLFLLAEALAEALMGGVERVVDQDLGPMVNDEDKTLLIGSPPAYVGYQDHRPLHDVAQTPWCVLCLPNVDLCHPSIREIVTGMLADGYVTDSAGKRIFLSDTVVLLTAHFNLEHQGKTFGFGSGKPQEVDLHDAAQQALGHELVAQCDLLASRVIGDGDGLRQWVRGSLLADLSERYDQHGLCVQWHESLLDWILGVVDRAKDQREWEQELERRLTPLLMEHLDCLQEGERQSLLVRCEAGQPCVVVQETGRE